MLTALDRAALAAYCESYAVAHMDNWDPKVTIGPITSSAMVAAIGAGDARGDATPLRDSPQHLCSQPPRR
jgi:hypothetical protein